MYRINYISNIVQTSKLKRIVYKFLKLFNILVQIAIVYMVWQTVEFYKSIERYNTSIDIIKTRIEDKRHQNNIDTIEKNWTDTYYKLLATKHLVQERSTYGLLLKTFAENFPEGDKISNLSVGADAIEAGVGIKESRKASFEKEIKTYANVLKASYEKIDIFDKDNMEVLAVVNDKINDVNTEIVKVKIGLKRK